MAAGEQVLLFLNRRGYAPLTLCACGHRIQCPNCSAWLVEHRFRRQLCAIIAVMSSLTATVPACDAEELVPAARGSSGWRKRWPSCSPMRRRRSSPPTSIAAAAQGCAQRCREGPLRPPDRHPAGGQGPPLPEADAGRGGGCRSGPARPATRGPPSARSRSWRKWRAERAAAKAGRAPADLSPTHPVMQALKAGDRDRFLSHERGRGGGGAACHRSAGLPG